MRYLMAGVALAPFLVLMVGMATGRARVQACCAPTTVSEPTERHGIDAPESVGDRSRPETARGALPQRGDEDGQARPTTVTHPRSTASLLKERAPVASG